jgi:hypothetical protein
LILALRGEIQALKLRLVSTTTVKVTDGETGAIVILPKILFLTAAGILIGIAYVSDCCSQYGAPI